MRSRKTREIDTAFKPIVRDRQITAVSMIAYLGIVFSVLFFAQFLLIHIFNTLYPLYGNIYASILPIALISVLVILFWSIRYFRFPVVLVLFVIYVIWLFFKITSDLETPNDVRTFLDVFLKAMSEYYGFPWEGFGVGSDAGILEFIGTQNSVLNAVLMIHLPFTALLGYSMIRKFRFTSVGLALLLPCFIVMMNGYMPDRFALILVIFIFAVLAVLGIQMKIEEKQQMVGKRNGTEDKGSPFCIRPPKSVLPLYGILMATCIAAMAFPPLLEEKINEAVKPVQEYMYSGGPEKLLRALRNKLFGSHSGGISGGDLASTGSIKPDKDHVLLKLRFLDDAHTYTYLKCYVGEVYTGKRWEDLPDLIRNQYADLIPAELSQREYNRLEETGRLLDSLSPYNMGDARLNNRLNIYSERTYITNVDYSDGYQVIPYMTYLPDPVNIVKFPYLREEPAIETTQLYWHMNCSYNTLVRLYDAYCHENGYLDGVTDTPENLADAFYDEIYSIKDFGGFSQDNGRLIPVFLFQYYGPNEGNSYDRAYDQILNEYLTVPDSVVKLREYMKNVRVDGVEDAILYVRETLDELADYSLNPGRISGGQDFVDSFLFEKQAGYCMHFASAGTIMFRLLGIPARYVEGFYVDPTASDEQEITEENAHAWTEIYLRNFGWIPIEVTPGFGSEEWKRRETQKPKPTVPATTTSGTETDTTATPATEGPTVKPTEAPTQIQPVPGKPAITVPHTLPSEEADGNGVSIFPIVKKILVVAGSILGILVVVYLLILLRRSLLLSGRHRGFSQKDAKKSISALYMDMRRLASIEQRRFTYETDPAEVIRWFSDLAEDEELITQAIEAINLCFFGNRELTSDERKTVRMARNKLAAAVAKRQTGRKKWRFRLWYGY